MKDSLLMPPGKRSNAPQLTTAQQLASLLKSVRDIMRKDKGLNGDADRLPMMTWLLFLKFLDDNERHREDEAILGGKSFVPAIQKPYRWRDWADDVGFTGDNLLNFINLQDKATLPNGSEGKGLLAYLRGIGGHGDRRDVIANLFAGVNNRMINGYLLRDVVDKLNNVHFDSNDEIHTLSRLYESMLKEMRDAAGDGGEFYTPRPVVRFMVEALNPQLGETVLDPACGTGGFLVEAFAHLKKAVRNPGTPPHLAKQKRPGWRSQAPTLPAGTNEPAAARAGATTSDTRQQSGRQALQYW